MHPWLSALTRPIAEENRRLLAQRWNELPPELQVPWQAVGRHLPHCGFVLGPAYCSFGCTHCYLPANANRVPLPTFDQMKAQIDANRRLLGHAGNLQMATWWMPTCGPRKATSWCGSCAMPPRSGWSRC